MKQVRLTRAARNDLKRILRRSETEFGQSIRARYKALLDHAISDLAVDSGRNGVKPIDDVRPGYFIYHIKWSKPAIAGPSVKRPRHLLVFSLDDDDFIVIAAVVHERELLARHLAD